ncbi:hypothetical protein BH10ACI4_BH10ACI4_31090 [soil metagenome]
MTAPAIVPYNMPNGSKKNVNTNDNTTLFYLLVMNEMRTAAPGLVALSEGT